MAYTCVLFGLPRFAYTTAEVMENPPILKGVVTSEMIRVAMREVEIPEGMEYIDPDNPELGWQMKPPRRANFGSIQRFIEDKEIPGGVGWPE